jgi:hypothetical protein
MCWTNAYLQAVASISICAVFIFSRLSHCCAAGITCCHGQLAPESLSGTARRSVVSEEAWSLLREVWLMQVVREVGCKRAKAAKAAAAARAAAGVLDDAGAADDGEQHFNA